MPKQLVLLNTYFSDFRNDLIEEYESMYAAIKGDGFKIVDDRAIVDNVAIDPKQCVIFNHGLGKYMGFGKDFYLSSLGYVVDSPSYSSVIVENKDVLFAYMKRFGATVPSVYRGQIPPTPYYLKYSDNETIRLEVVENKDQKLERWDTTIMGGWTEPNIRGFLVYFYMFEPMFCTPVTWSNLDRLHAKFFNEDYVTIIKASERVGTVYNTAEGTPKPYKVILDGMGKLPSNTLETLKVIPRILRSPSCEVLLGKTVGDKFILLNVEVTHEPLTQLFLVAMDEDSSFETQVTEGFLKFMEIPK